MANGATEMTRVLALVTYRIIPTLMGGQKGVAFFYEALEKHTEVLLALSQNNEVPETDHQKKLLYTNRLLPLNGLRIGVLKKWIQQEKVQLLIAEHSYAGWIALLLKRKTGAPFVIHSHNLEGLRFKHMHRWWWRLYTRYEKWIHQKADFNFFISDADKDYAIRYFHLDALKCATITYGVQPFEAKSLESKNAFLQSLGIANSCAVLFFNGTLDYKPNYEAVYLLATEIAPRLRSKGQLFKILISGKRISKKLQSFIHHQPDLLYLDYVPDINLVYQASQLFVNPILNNTGVKTKVLEAIANQCTVVSTTSGAAGIFKDVCDTKLLTVPDQDWDAFVNTVVLALQQPFKPTPASFFNTYLWSNIAQKAAAEINKIAVKR